MQGSPVFVDGPGVSFGLVFVQDEGDEFVRGRDFGRVVFLFCKKFTLVAEIVTYCILYVFNMSIIAHCVLYNTVHTVLATNTRTYTILIKF